MPTYELASRTFKVALDHFRSRQAPIEARVWQEIDDGHEAKTYLKNANKELGQNIIAALTFGNMDLLTTNLEWIQGLLVNYHYRLPEKMMHTYMEAYYTACQACLDERGAPILDWLGTLLEE